MYSHLTMQSCLFSPMSGWTTSKPSSKNSPILINLILWTIFPAKNRRFGWSSSKHILFQERSTSQKQSIWSKKKLTSVRQIQKIYRKSRIWIASSLFLDLPCIFSLLFFHGSHGFPEATEAICRTWTWRGTSWTAATQRWPWQRCYGSRCLGSLEVEGG